ncbi:Putative iron-sulfur cluster assembly scaffold protein for SUF system, SufE2 [hydrothermal vent metagenome]|uniref:Iron-sulfur cluster assembly scaffold protein for SUF system, SufE2 n=1 Tax=hydrothermal vent metagenome TaxID=652676 RepID=A0A3B0TY05_9ZZZZ
MSISEIYSQNIIEIASRLPLARRLANPDASARKVSRICGSVVEVDLKLKDGAVIEYGQDINACALGQTSASIMAEHIIGSSAAELRALRDQVFSMLKQNGAPPNGKWGEIKYLEPVRDFAPRHASTMLVFDAVVDCLDQIEERVEK